MKYLVLKALFGFLMFDVMRFGANFSRLHRFVKGLNTRNRVAETDAAERARLAINWAAVIYPKRVRCLQRSSVFTWILRGLGIHAEMVMGNQKVPFKAHAWTEVEGKPINERRAVQTIYEVWERC